MGIHNAPKSLVIQPNHISPKQKQKPCFWNVEQQPQSGVEAFPISEIPQELCGRRAEHQNSPLYKTGTNTDLNIDTNTHQNIDTNSDIMIGTNTDLNNGKNTDLNIATITDLKMVQILI